jgi:hypothetical protein
MAFPDVGKGPSAPAHSCLTRSGSGSEHPLSFETLSGPHKSAAPASLERPGPSTVALGLPTRLENGKPLMGLSEEETPSADGYGGHVVAMNTPPESPVLT